MARKLNDWIGAYLDYTRNLEALQSFHFWSGVAAVAGALGGKCWIDMGMFRWKPNFFIIFVAHPGVVQKSTSIEVAMRPLRQMENIAFGPNSVTWQRLAETFTEARQVEELDDASLVEHSSINIVASELGTFFDPRNKELVDVLVDLWDGREVPWKRGTKGEGDYTISNPWLNFIGATTPAWMAENFPEYAIGGGFASRTIWIYGESKRNLIAYPADHITPEDQQLKDDLVNDLAEISKFTGEFKLTDEARTWGKEWYDDLWSNPPEHLRSERMGGYLSRKQTHAHKLAMILSASRRDDMQITVDELAGAVGMITALEVDMSKVFSFIADSDSGRNMQSILNVLKNHGTDMRASEIWKKLLFSMTQKEFYDCLSGAARAGVVEVYSDGKESRVKLVQEEESEDQPS